MTARRGVCYVAYGDNARREAEASIRSLRQFQRWPVCVIGEPVKGANIQIPFKGKDDVGRWAKCNLDRLSPWDDTLYLDADTRIRAKGLAEGFRILDNGWDLTLVGSWLLGPRWLWWVSEEERQATQQETGAQFTMYGGGVLFWKRNPDTSRLWALWREEWLRYRGADMGALMRAMFRAPVRTWFLGKPFNGGAVVQHRWGKAKRR